MNFEAGLINVKAKYFNIWYENILNAFIYYSLVMQIMDQGTLYWNALRSKE